MTFRCRGVEVSLSFWFFCGATLLLTADRSGLSGLVFLSIAIHEGGHLLYMLLARLPLGRVRLGAAGLILELRPGCRPAPGQSLLLNLSGAAANLLAALLLARAGGMAALRLSAVNAALGAANLLPVPGLDGAQALEDLLVLLLGWERGPRVHRWMMTALCILGIGGCGWLISTRGLRPAWVCLLVILAVGLVR